MSTTDNAPDSNRDGGEKSYADFFDDQRLMVRVPEFLFENLVTSEGIATMRGILKTWFLTYIREFRGPYNDLTDTDLYEYLDDFLSGLLPHVLHREFLESHNIKSDPAHE